MKESVIVIFDNKRRKINVWHCSFFGKFLGLMFSKRESAPVLLFDFGHKVNMGIHSFFVFYDFLTVWLDEKNRVVQVDRVKPWVPYLRPKKKYSKLIEIPINRKNRDLVRFFLD